MLLIIVSHQLLVQREIHLVGCDGAAVVPGDVDFVDNLLHRRKVLLDGLIHQNNPVGKIEDLPLHTALQKAINDLKGSIGFAGAGGHNKQKAIPALRDGVQRAVDGDALIAAGRIGILAAVIYCSLISSSDICFLFRIMQYPSSRM